MANPFKPDDKVITKQQGVDVEAIVRLIYNDEVQVRTPDGVLRWRTAKTVWFPEQPRPAIETDVPQVEPEAEAGAAVEATIPAPEVPIEQPAPDIELPAEETAPEVEEEVAGGENTPEAETSVSAEAVVPEQEETEPQPPVQNPPLVHASLEYTSCGVPETMAQRKRNRKGGRRR